MSAAKMRNIGPKSAAWLRQVGLRSLEDIAAIGTVDAFMKAVSYTHLDVYKRQVRIKRRFSFAVEQKGRIFTGAQARRIVAVLRCQDADAVLFNKKKFLFCSFQQGTVCFALHNAFRLSFAQPFYLPQLPNTTFKECFCRAEMAH